MPDPESPDLTALTVQLLSAYVSNNTVPSEELAALIGTTRSALGGKSEPVAEPAPEYPPAVTVRKSLGSKEHILSMIDGRPYKTLKRHLSRHGLTPREYRERYSLPSDYPMVAVSYSQHRREVAERLGLGRRKIEPQVETTEPQDVAAAVEPTTKAPRVKAKPGQKPGSRRVKASNVAPESVVEAIVSPAPGEAIPKRRGRKPKAVAPPVDTTVAKQRRPAKAAPSEATATTPKRPRKSKAAPETT